MAVCFKHRPPTIPASSTCGSSLDQKPEACDWKLESSRMSPGVDDSMCRSTSSVGILMASAVERFILGLLTLPHHKTVNSPAPESLQSNWAEFPERSGQPGATHWERGSSPNRPRLDSSSRPQLRPKKRFLIPALFRPLSSLPVLDGRSCHITWPPIGERAGRVFPRRVVCGV